MALEHKRRNTTLALLTAVPAIPAFAATALLTTLSLLNYSNYQAATTPKQVYDSQFDPGLGGIIIDLSLVTAIFSGLSIYFAVAKVPNLELLDEKEQLQNDIFMLESMMGDGQ